MASCTLFKNFSDPVENKSLLLIGKDIKSGKYRKEIEEIRTLIKQGKKVEADSKKKQLLAFTPSAVFFEKRLIPNIEMYSGFVHLDFDKLNQDQLKSAIDIVSKINYTALSFISPGGSGIKVFVEVNTGLEHHSIAYLQVMKYYEDATGLKADPSCKDVTRLCFVSYDPNAYRNINSEKFIIPGVDSLETKKEFKIEKPIESSENFNNDLDLIFKLNQVKQFTDQKISYTEGNRNTYIYQFASNCNRGGIPQDNVENYCFHNFDLSPSEIKSTVKSAYIHHQAESNKYPFGDQKNIVPFNEEVNMPVFPDSIFVTLPTFLQRVTDISVHKEERDILLLASLVTLSVGFPKIFGRYADNKVNANLFLFISAKASGGKGVINHCKKLVDPIHKELRGEASKLKQIYESEMLQFNASKGKKANVEKPQKPLQKMLFIPANNSATGFLELLGDNKGSGLIFETEGDTLSNSFKSDYGDFSDGFRKAFHHESISYYRRTDKEYVEIERPALSTVLLGTPQQITILIPNAENGLFSRFIFYAMNMNLTWKNVFASNTDNGLEDYFIKLGYEFYGLYSSLKNSPELIFSLTNEQILRFNSFFSEKQNLYITIQEEDIISTVRRLGLIAFRIMMIFSGLRIMENGLLPKELVCEDNDFENTLKIIEILLKHCNYIFTQISGNSYKPKPKHRKELFLENLPINFNRQNYVSIALNLGIPDKTAQKYIKDFVDNGIIENTSHDNYSNPSASIPQ